MLGTQGCKGFNIFFSFPTTEPVNTQNLTLHIREELRPAAHVFPYEYGYHKLSVLMWYKFSRKSLCTTPPPFSTFILKLPQTSILQVKKETVVGLDGQQNLKSSLPAASIRVSTAEHVQALYHGPHAGDGCRLSQLLLYHTLAPALAFS